VAIAGSRQFRVRVTKLRILVLTEFYYPGFRGGGPIRSLVNLIGRLAEQFEWRVLTSDRDCHAKDAYAGIVIDRWTRVGAADVLYVSPKKLSLVRLIRELRKIPHEILYLNSFFSLSFSIVPVLAQRLGLIRSRAVLVAPRGEFSAGAYGLKVWKKLPFVWLVRLFGVYAKVVWHASTPYEAHDIARVMGARSSRMHVATNLIEEGSAGVLTPLRRPAGALRVCWLSRISRMKNLDFALLVLGQVKQPVKFTIYGPIEDEQYWLECMALIDLLPAHVDLQIAGPIPGNMVREALSQHDMFFLPTRGENFGHVFVEAWSAGLSVLTSDQTPWRRLEEKGIGWDLPLREVKRFTERIDSVAVWPADEFAERRKDCLRFFESQSSDLRAIASNADMFAAIGGVTQRRWHGSGSRRRLTSPP